jgi:hypothetical protein
MKSPKPCEECQAYAQRRAQVLAPEIELRAFIRGVMPEVVAREFMHGVHLRHLAGKSLDTTQPAVA